MKHSVYTQLIFYNLKFVFYGHQRLALRCHKRSLIRTNGPTSGQINNRNTQIRQVALFDKPDEKQRLAPHTWLLRPLTCYNHKTHLFIFRFQVTILPQSLHRSSLGIHLHVLQFFLILFIHYTPQYVFFFAVLIVAVVA